MRMTKLQKFVVALVILLIPVALNFLLSVDTGLNVISGGSQAIWLAFWGTYLSACGTIVVAWLSYQQNRSFENVRKHQKKMGRYDLLEGYVCDMQETFHFLNLAFVNLKFSKGEGLSDGEKKSLHNMSIRANLAVCRSHRFHDIISYDDTYARKVGCGYFVLLQKINNDFLRLIEDATSEKVDMKNWIELYDTYSKYYANHVITASDEVLDVEWRIISEFENKHGFA